MSDILLDRGRSVLTLAMALGCAAWCSVAAATEYNVAWANPTPQGNAVYSLAFEDGDVGIAVGDRGAVLRTSDRGRTWIDLANGSKFDADLRSVVALGSGEYLAVGSSPGIFRTVDGGRHWSPVPNPSTVTLLDVEITAPGTLFAIGKGGQTLRSDNHGATWALMTPPGAFDLEGQYWWDGDTGFVVGFFTAVKTTDGGVTWTALQDPLTLGAQDMTDIHFEDADNGWILDHFSTYRTTDGGVTWFEKHGRFGLSPVYQEDAVFFGVDHRLVITFLEGAEIWETLDDGENWTVLYQRLGTGGYADIDRLPDGSLVTCSSFGDLLWSTDQGQNWQNFTRCPDDLDRAHVEAIGSAPGGLSLAGGRNALWLQSNDSGLTWEAPTATPSIETAHSIVFRDGLFALAGGYTPGQPSRVSRTTDGGATWVDFELTGSYVGYPQEIVIPEPSTAYVVTWGGNGVNHVFRSDDGGETWADRSPVVPADLRLSSIVFFDSEMGIVAGGDFSSEAVMWKTTDGGLSWAPVPEVGLEQAQITTMFWADSNTGLVGGYRGVFRTSDGGQTWNKVFDHPCTTMAFRTDLVGVAGSFHERGVWLTEDGGLNWALVDSLWTESPEVVAAAGDGFLIGSMGSVIQSMRPTGLVFTDGFEIGNTSGWSGPLARASHKAPAASANMPHPAAFSQSEVLDAPRVRLRASSIENTTGYSILTSSLRSLVRSSG